jgi:hypothetical protein
VILDDLTDVLFSESGFEEIEGDGGMRVRGSILDCPQRRRRSRIEKKNRVVGFVFAPAGHGHRRARLHAYLGRHLFLGGLDVSELSRRAVSLGVELLPFASCGDA